MQRKCCLGLVLCCCAGPGSWDGGSSWQAGSTAERQLCPGAGLGALPAGTERIRAWMRELKGSGEWEDAESSLEEKSSQPFTW